jgi:heme oxygenase
MSKLKELTWENHKKAERTRFIGRFLNRRLTPYQYYTYLSNQLMCYYVLEKAAEELKLLKGIETISRSIYISKDIAELEVQHGFKIPKTVPATQSYIDYIQRISRHPEKIMAHIYVRHMGDLYGGQILKKLVPGKGLYFHFDDDVDELKQKIRSRLNDDMADEANHCFEMIYSIFEELEESFGD